MIGVVGGGIAGLAAAYRLQQHGHEVRVFEASDDLGGLAATYETAGDDLEVFYHHLSRSERTIVELADELGLGDRIEWRIGRNAYYVDGVVHPLDTPWEILAFPSLGLYDTARLALLTQEIDVRGGRPRFDTYDDLSAFEDVPVREFVREHTTPGVYENFFEPLLDAKFGDRKEDVSAAWLLGRIKFRGERDLLRGEVLGYPEGGFAPLLDALVGAVGREHIETDAPVTALDFDEGAVTGLTAGRGADAATHDVDGVVVAAMPDVLESLAGYECDIDFQGAVCAVVTMEEPLTDTYWLNVANDAPFGALVEHTNFVPPDRYGGQHLLYVASYVQSPAEPNWQMDDEEVAETWLAAVEEMFPSFDRGAVTDVRVARNPRAAPIYERGYLEMVVPYDLSQQVAEGVYYAGMASRAQYPERSLDGGVVAGFECADRIAGKTEGGPRRPQSATTGRR
jgi:protoporphyrinogen oxidase